MSQKYADIIIDISHEAIDKTFQYKIPEVLEDVTDIGDMVLVPFGNSKKPRTGYVIDITDTPVYDKEKLKEIIGVPDKGLRIEGKLIRLAHWMKRNYGSTMINSLRTVMPVKEKVRKTAQRVQEAEYELEKPPVLELNDEQSRLVGEFSQDMENGIRKTYLLHGITGSGKTEVYIECIKRVIKQGRQAIVLIPEIALTYQNVARFRQHFGDRIAVINSKQSKGEKYQQFMRAKAHEVDVVIGPRSALFTPCEELGLIVIDEEHDGAYKSDQAPKYHARETAIELARLSDASVILGSATPTVTSYAMAKLGEYRLWTLSKRPDGRSLAKSSVVDLREELHLGNRSIVSKELHDDIEKCLEKHEQVMLFINRRGINSFVSCRECGSAIMCPKCDVSLALHGNGIMMCHYCGYTMKEPKQCPKCNSRMIGGFGTGTEKVEAEIKRLFPSAKTLRMDKDTTSRKGAHGDILSSFARHEADILIGTQMIVKGHDFPNVTLVGIMLADISLFSNDYRAGERTFNLLTQAAGRAGRGDRAGKVVIQTYQPEHYAVASAANQDYEGFFDMEMTYRRMMKYPPVYNMLVILIVSEDYELAVSSSEEIKRQLALIAGLEYNTPMNRAERDKARKKSIRIIGPSDATIGRINNLYRRVIYVKYKDYKITAEFGKYIDAYNKEKVSVMMDVNPVNMY